MASTSTATLADLYDDNQKTSAIGYPPIMGVTQGGPMDKTVTSIGVLASGGPGIIVDARDRAFSSSPLGGLPKWKKSEATGVHAEVIIIRAWLDLKLAETGMTMDNAIASLKGRVIDASQPACWCCHALMTKWGIVMANSTIGKKPSTGWRHPQAAATVANADLPKTIEDTNKWFGLKAT